MVRSARAALEGSGASVDAVEVLDDGALVQLRVDGSGLTRAELQECVRGIACCDVGVRAANAPLPKVFVSDMDSTMIGQECIDELADYAGLKPQIAAITERAMQGELDFEAALRERVALLKGLPITVIDTCLSERIRPMAGAATLVATLKAHGVRTVLVSGGFHQFADRVAEWLGFDHVVANRLEVADGVLTGGLVGAIVDAQTKAQVIADERHALTDGAGGVIAIGDGANDIPMLQSADTGFAYHAKPAAAAAADSAIAHSDLTAVLDMVGVARADWIVR